MCAQSLPWRSKAVGFTCLLWAGESGWGTCPVLSSVLCSRAAPHSCREDDTSATGSVKAGNGRVLGSWSHKPYQYKTSSPHSTSNRKWEKATGAESLSRASRYHALSSFISSLFSLSFQPHSLCSYLRQTEKKQESDKPMSPQPLDPSWEWRRLIQ